MRILIVDDYEPWRRFVCGALQMQPNLQIIGEAGDGLEAVQQTQALRPDLIVMDIGLPALNGIEASHRIHRLYPETKILFASQNNDRDVLEAALSNGARGYLLKADGQSELLDAIEAVSRGEKFVSKGLKFLQA